MIDIHCHILPGVDDGATNLDEALMMARLAAASGIRRIVATPHMSGWDGPTMRTLAAQVRNLQRELNSCGIPVNLAVGCEMRLTCDLLLQTGDDRFHTLNGSRYLLVELPNSDYPACTDAVIFDLQVRGLVPILAHPERHPVIQADPGRLGLLVDRGVMVQLSAGNLLSGADRRTRHTAERILKQGWAHVLASDAHDADGRAPDLAQGLIVAARLVGREHAEAMARSIPEAILADRMVNSPVPRFEPMARGWSWLSLR